MRQKKCKHCKHLFTPKTPLQSVCSFLCAMHYAKVLERKKEAKRLKVAKESLLTKSDYLKMAQQVFNAYIRKRDEKLCCVTCGTSLVGRKFDAGHFLSVGSHPNLRFHEDNVHGQCVPCNQHKHGNQAEYFIRLPKRIGEERFNKLLEERKRMKHYTITEIKEIIKIYKSKIKEHGKN